MKTSHNFRAAGLSCSLCIVLLTSTSIADAQQRSVHAIHSATSQPIAFKEGDGPSRGFMIEVCNAIAADNGWTIDYSTRAFADLLPTLAAAQADMICSSFGYTPERAAQVAFTPTVYEGGEGMVVLKTDMTAYRGWAEVASEPVGGVRGTIHLAAMERSGLSNVQIFDSNPAGAAAVVSGEVKAFFTNQPSLAYMLQNGYPELRLVETYQPSVLGAFNIAVRKDNPELLAAVNASLAKLGAAGTIRELRAAWGF